MLWKYYFLFSVVFLIWAIDNAATTATIKLPNDIEFERLNKFMNNRLGESPVKIKCVNPEFWDHNDFKWTEDVMDVLQNESKTYKVCPYNKTYTTVCSDYKCEPDMETECCLFLIELNMHRWDLIEDDLNKIIIPKGFEHLHNPTAEVLILFLISLVTFALIHLAHHIRLDLIIEKVCEENRIYWLWMSWWFFVSTVVCQYVDGLYFAVIWGALMSIFFGAITNYFIFKDLFIHIFVKENIPKQIVIVNYEV